MAGEDDPQASAEQARLHAALRRLPVAMLEVVLMAEFSGMGTREIAQALGIPEGTVASRKHGAVLRLKQWLGEG
jgi:RNA polymerase sigma-70 factor (ECF subfamily)